MENIADGLFNGVCGSIFKTIQVKETRPTKIKPSCIVVISALNDELDYLYDEKHFRWKGAYINSDGISYRRGIFNSGIDIIATCAHNKGLVATSIITARALNEWKPDIAVMIGVCGGRKEKGLNIGDIVVPNKTFHYQYGAFENGEILRELLVENIEMQVIETVEQLKRNNSTLQRIYSNPKRGFKKPITLLQCHIGPIACADLVIKDDKKLLDAIEADRQTIAVDMESYAFMNAARLSRIRYAFVIKSVSDFADAKKDDEYREYAKFSSTKFTLQVLRNLTGTKLNL